jgi:hypothetical protein
VREIRFTEDDFSVEPVSIVGWGPLARGKEGWIKGKIPMYLIPERTEQTLFYSLPIFAPLFARFAAEAEQNQFQIRKVKKPRTGPADFYHFLHQGHPTKSIVHVGINASF